MPPAQVRAQITDDVGGLLGFHTEWWSPGHRSTRAAQLDGVRCLLSISEFGDVRLDSRRAEPPDP